MLNSGGAFKRLGKLHEKHGSLNVVVHLQAEAPGAPDCEAGRLASHSTESSCPSEGDKDGVERVLRL